MDTIFVQLFIQLSQGKIETARGNNLGSINTSLAILAVFLFMRCAGSKTVHVTWVENKNKVVEIGTETLTCINLIFYFHVVSV